MENPIKMDGENNGSKPYEQMGMIWGYITLPHLPVFLNIWNQGVDRYLIYWLAWELGSKYMGNWKIRACFWFNTHTLARMMNLGR